jgi:uncharacterized protein (TIGR02271 family)
LVALNITMDSKQQNPEQDQSIRNSTGDNPIVIPVIEEHMTVEKEVIEAAKVHVRTKVTEEEATVYLPITSELYEVRRVEVDKVYNTAPPVRYEGDTIIVPVIEEIVVVEKRYKVKEEVHLVKHTTETPFMQQVTLRKENVQVDRISPEGKKTKL